MENELFKRTILEASRLFYLNGTKNTRYDEKYIAKSCLEIIDNRGEYEQLALTFPFLPPELIFFLKLSFGEKEGKLYQCLLQAEQRYKLEIRKSKFSTDLIRESVQKACIISLQTGKSFRVSFSSYIIKPSCDDSKFYKKNRIPVTKENVLDLVLNKLENVGVYPQDLFVQQVSR